MKRITRTVVGLAALGVMLVLGVFSAGSASAAARFLYTGPLPAQILFLSTGTQVLKTEPGAGTGTITCTHFGGVVEVPANKMETTTVKAVGEYHTCKSFGKTAVVSPIEYEINANGSVTVLKEITIGTLDGTCTVKVPVTGNSNLQKVLFLNIPSLANPGDILLHSDVTGIHSTVMGGAGICGTVGVENKEGSYTGLVLVFAHNGGTISWHES